MPTADYSSYHQPSGSAADGTKFSNFVDAVQTTVNALDNNNIAAGAGIVFSKLSGPYTAYTPTWTASGTAPAIGNSTVVARYLQIGKFVHAWGSITFGNTATFGTGNYTFALPVAPSASLGLQTTLGSGDIFDTSATFKASPMWELSSGSNVWMIYPAAWPSGTSSAVSATTPWTWAVGDIISWNLTYEAA